jgi:hypothetical protein
MRPSSILWFELLSLAALTIDIFQAVLEWREAERADPAASIALTLYLPISVVVVTAMLVLLVSRLRSGIAKWLWITFCGPGVFSTFMIIVSDSLSGGNSTELFQTALQLTAMALLFTTPSRDWIRR